jgi:heme/copper-type cytochrome/quinol oxidase subunit 2
MEHGFAIPEYGISLNVTPGVDVNGTVSPVDTVVPTFTATTPGVFQFYCTVYCGEGHSQMIGYFVVLPRTASSGTSTASG